MATSGQIQTNTAFGYVRLSWSTSSQSIDGNTSTISYTLSIYRSSSISSSTAKSYSIKFNGITVASGTTTIGGSGTKTIKTGTTTIAHNADGTKTFSYSFSQQIDITWSGTFIGTVTGSGNGTLDTIPRATTPTLSATTTEMGSAVTITMNRASSLFTHTLTYTFGGAIGTIGSSLATSITWTIPLTLANQIPNTVSGTGTITCKTYNGSTLIGTKTVSFIATVPSTVVPVINSATVTETVTAPNIAKQFSAFVQYKSKPQVAITATGVYGSTITAYKVYIRDSSNNDLAIYFGSTIIADPIQISGTIKVVAQVTDSRGRSASYSQNITVLAYELPKIVGFAAFRCNSDGTANYEGTCANISLNFEIATVNNLNTKYYEVRYRQKDATSWTIAACGNIYTRNDSFVTGAVFNADNAYELRLQLYDFFTGTAFDLEIPTAFTLVDFRSTGKGIAFGKVSEKDEMEIALDVDLTGELLQENIQTPTLLNSWVDYGAAYQGAGYWKDKCGVVHLCGLIKGGTITAETVIFNLPTGYRPATSEKFFAVSLNAICVIDIYSSGAVAIKTGANAGWLSLSGITFKAA